MFTNHPVSPKHWRAVLLPTTTIVTADAVTRRNRTGPPTAKRLQSGQRDHVHQLSIAASVGLRRQITPGTRLSQLTASKHDILTALFGLCLPRGLA